MDGGRRETISQDEWSVYVEGHGVIVRVSEGRVGQPTYLTIQVDPAGRDGAFMLDIAEIASSAHQARIVVAAKDQA